MTKQRLAIIALALSLNLIFPPAMATPDEAVTCRLGQATTSNNYDALLWYRNSAERKILYRQIFNDALEQIEYTVSEDKLKSKTWGVVFALDGTLVDNSNQYLNSTIKCLSGIAESTLNGETTTNSLSLTPGAKEISCGVKKLGGYVIIISNRNGDGVTGKKLLFTTQVNLEQQKLCYDNIIFANNQYDSDKNPRFTAVSSGDYENVITTHQLPSLKIVAYLGSNIEDFPNLKQATAKNLAANSPQLDDFGENFFLLPNPLFGLWQHNRLK